MGLATATEASQASKGPFGLLLSRPLSPGPVAPRRNSHHRGAEGQARAQRRRQGRLRDRGRLCARPSEKALPLPLRGSVRRTQWAQQHERRRAPRQGAKGYERLGPLGFGLGCGLLHLSRARTGPLSPGSLGARVDVAHSASRAGVVDGFLRPHAL